MRVTEPLSNVVADAHASDILRMMVAAAPVAVIAVDATGQVLFANHKLAEMFGYAVGELLGGSLELLIPERYRTDHVLHRAEYGTNPRLRAMGSGLDLAGRRKDGSEFPIEVGLSHFETDNGLLVMASILDITRRKQTEEVLERRVQERTQEIERRRQVADSLREILAMLNSNRPLQEILDHIVAQASRLLKADAGAIYQLDDDSAPMTIQASFGLSAQQLSAALPPELAQVVANGTNGRSPVTLAPDSASPVASSRQDYCAQLAVPLRMEDDTYGGLLLYYGEPRKFTTEELELAVMFGDQATLAIENARLRAQAERTAVAAERNRIARDLHDSVTQTLFSATLIAEVLPRLVQRNQVEGVRRVEELRQLTRSALAEMRTLLLELRPATLTEVSIEELLRQLTEAARGRAQLPIDVTMAVLSPPPPEVKIAFYYVAQEALNNVAKHARARKVAVQLHSSHDSASLSVCDDGQGFEIGQVTPEHLGLAIMRERSEAINGRLEIQSLPGHGTTVTIHWQSQESDDQP